MATLYGFAYIGTVEDNEDPEDLGRVRVRIEAFHGDAPTENLPWARTPARGVGFGQGPQPVPQTGVDVLVVFEQGRPENPVVVTELRTVLDPRNATERRYTSGARERIVEDSWTDFTGRTRTIKAGRSILLNALGSIERTARQRGAGIGGRRKVAARREDVDILGGSSRVWRGVAEWKFLSDLTKTVVGKLNLSVSAGVDLFVVGIPLISDLNITTMFTNFVVNAITPGIIWLRQRSPIPDPTGILDLAQVKTDPVGNVYILTNTGLVRVGRVATGGLLATPVTLAAHTHVAVGNLGLPIVVQPTPPTPPNISTSLFAE